MLQQHSGWQKKTRSTQTHASGVSFTRLAGDTVNATTLNRSTRYVREILFIEKVNSSTPIAPKNILSYDARRFPKSDYDDSDNDSRPDTSRNIFTKRKQWWCDDDKKKSNNNKLIYINLGHTCVRRTHVNRRAGPASGLWSCFSVCRRNEAKEEKEIRRKKQPQPKRIYSLSAHTDQPNRIEIKYHKRKWSEMRRERERESEITSSSFAVSIWNDIYDTWLFIVTYMHNRERRLYKRRASRALLTYIYYVGSSTLPPIAYTIPRKITKSFQKWTSKKKKKPNE